MIRLKNKHYAQKALVIFGGASVVVNGFPFDAINKRGTIIFLESKALTPHFLASGLIPDYYLMFYPEKCNSNSFQHVVFQSLLADIDLSVLIKREFCSEYLSICNNFDLYFEHWRPHKGPHKRYRYKHGAYFKNSPFDLLGRLPDMDVLTYKKPFTNYAEWFPYGNKVYQYDMCRGEEEFSLDDYFFPQDNSGELLIKDYSFLNSAAIALYPILNYMGFKDVSFLGMDMSMLGSMEYSSYYTFKSMRHFGKFFKKASKVFSAVFKENRLKFMRPTYEFDALKQILKFKGMKFMNVYEPFKYALPIKGIDNIGYKDFLKWLDHVKR